MILHLNSRSTSKQVNLLSYITALVVDD